MMIIRNLTINKFNFMVKLFKIIIKISPIIAQYRAPFFRMHPLRCFFCMYSKPLRESDFIVFTIFFCPLLLQKKEPFFATDWEKRLICAMWLAIRIKYRSINQLCVIIAFLTIACYHERKCCKKRFLFLPEAKGGIRWWKNICCWPVSF